MLFASLWFVLLKLSQVTLAGVGAFVLPHIPCVVVFNAPQSILYNWIPAPPIYGSKAPPRLSLIPNRRCATTSTLTFSMLNCRSQGIPVNVTVTCVRQICIAHSLTMHLVRYWLDIRAHCLRLC